MSTDTKEDMKSDGVHNEQPTAPVHTVIRKVQARRCFGLCCPYEKEVREDPRQLTFKDGKILPERDPEGNEIIHVTNIIRSSKYTLWNFLPKNLFEQLTRPANFYFVIIAALQIIPAISISNGKPTILLPLVIVLTVSGVKDAFEDLKRHKADTSENEREYLVRTAAKGDEEFDLVTCQAIRVGDFVKVLDDEPFPSDLLLVHSGSEDGGYCYVETSNLDGETNLKIKMVPEILRSFTPAQLKAISMRLICEYPSGKLDTFGGLLKVVPEKGNENRQKKEMLVNLDNLLLRGAKLKNTGFIIGLAVYTGEESKIRMNSTEKRRTRVKRSTVELTMNRFILGMFAAQLFVCVMAGLAAGLWDSAHRQHSAYLVFTDSSAYTGFLKFWTWLIIFNGFVPISLLVSMELVKFWQGLFISWDAQMCYTASNGEVQYARAQTSGLNEELGQVQYVLSDKTGTLTCNSMDFRKSIAGGVQYGSGDTDISLAAKQRASFVASSLPRAERDNTPTEIAAHVNFNARKRMQAVLAKYDKRGDPKTEKGEVKHAREVRDYLLALALANTVFPTVDEQGKSILKASSPDEEALVEFARFMGFELFERNPPYVKIRITPEGGESYIEEYEELASLDFTSKRKRMSVILRCPDKRVVRVISKGADTHVEPLLRGYGGSKSEFRKHQTHWDSTLDTLSRFGDDGLRTLVLASCTRDASWWDTTWNSKYRQKMKEIVVEGPAEEGHFKGGCKDQCRRCILEDSIERDAGLDLLGATAIEDKLQDNVPSTIKAMLDGGMSVWVLTGDKLETAINIGMACSLLESSMERKGNLLRVEGSIPEVVQEDLQRHKDYILNLRQTGSKAPVGLVVTSQAYACIVDAGPTLIEPFLWVATSCKSVIACRMQPNQKASLVKLVKDSQKVTTLAVGDGANDEQMIREANVGVGIRGVEGTTAVRAADYAVSQFSFLRRLLFVHGRLNLRRIALLIVYIFYKNTFLCFVQLWFGIFSGFSGQTMFLEWAYQCYNVVFTAFPILIFAVLDWDLPAVELYNTPTLYAKTQHGELFNRRIFATQLMFGLIQSLAVFGIPQAAFWSAAMDSTGQNIDLFAPGIAVYTCVVIVVNFKLALTMRSWSWLHHLSIWGSILAYFLVMIILNSNSVFGGSGADYYFLVFRVMGTPKFWLVVIVTTIAASGLDFGFNAYNQLTAKARARVDAAREAKNKKPAPLKFDMELTRQSSATPTAADSARRKATTASDDGGVTDPSLDRQPSASPRNASPSSPRSNNGPSSAAAVAAAREEEETAALFPAPSKLPSSSMGATAAAAEHQRRHTGFDFDYTPGEAHRLSVRHESPQTQERRTTLHAQPVNPKATEAPLLEYKDDTED